MRDEDDGAGVLREEVFEPADGVDIQMVGRFVEEQQVGLADERTGEQHAPTPSAGQRVDDGIGGEVEPRQHQLDALLEAPAVALLELVLQSPEPLEPRRAAVARRLDGGVVIVGRERGEVAETFGDDVEDGSAARERHVLHRAARRESPAAATRCRCPAAASPSRICSSVDLPAPFRPIIAIRSPGSI